MSGGVLRDIDVAIQNLVIAEFIDAEVEPLREARATVAEYERLLGRAAGALFAFGQCGHAGANSLSKEITDYLSHANGEKK
jgi:nitrite reductase/ring-hydroxylating ferredoxin subunit